MHEPSDSASSNSFNQEYDEYAIRRQFSRSLLAGVLQPLGLSECERTFLLPACDASTACGVHILLRDDWRPDEMQKRIVELQTTKLCCTQTNVPIATRKLRVRN